jgi:hypothetical protein
MTRYVENPIYCEAIEKFRDELADFHIDEVSLTNCASLFQIEKLFSESKICVLELVAEKLEKDVELVDSQIQSYNFIDPKEFLENLPSPKQEEIVLPIDLQIDDDYVFKYKAEIVDAWFDFEDATDLLVIKDLGMNIMHHAFIDPIADYMEVYVSSSFQTCFLYNDQICHQLPVHISALIFIKHDEEAQSWDQLLGWLHWHFFIT